MKFAFQTILWGPHPKDYAEILTQISEAGFTGVEFAQAPDDLPDPKLLKVALEVARLELVGLCAGTIEARIKYCQEGDLKPVYLYVESCEVSGCSYAACQDFRLALHPHKYTEHGDMDVVCWLLKEYEQLAFLPDTAHLYLLHESPLEVIKEYWDKVIGVHIKDWSSCYGRSFHRYAKGFVGLGEGEVPVKQVVSELTARQFDGWVVIERDFTSSSPGDVLEQSKKWIAENTSVPLQPRTVATIPSLPSRRIESPPKLPAEVRLNITELILRTTNVESVQAFSANVIKALVTELNCVSGTVWECSPTINCLGFLAAYPNDFVGRIESAMPYSNCFSGKCIETKNAERFASLDRNDSSRTFRPNGDGSSLLHGEKHMISIPVPNSYNANQVELVINLFGGSEPVAEVTDQEFRELAASIALGFEAVLAETCKSTASRVERTLLSQYTLKGYASESARAIREFLKCDGVSIFLADETGKRLYEWGTTGITWNLKPECYRVEGVDKERATARAFRNRQPKILYKNSEADAHLPRSLEIIKDDDNNERPVCLIYPIEDAHGDAIGVIRCRRSQKRDRKMFTECDVSIMDAVCRALAPNMTLLIDDYFRTRAQDRLTHELKMPLHVIAGATEAIDEESRKKRYRFDFPYTDDINEYLGTLTSLLKKWDRFRYSRQGRNQALLPRPEPTLLLRDVVAPVKNQLNRLLRERGLPVDGISDDGFKAIPEIWVDRDMFRQVFFNLLGNAIKYSGKNVNRFAVRIETSNTSNYFAIRIMDYGIGVPAGFEVAIFKEYVRAEGAHDHNVAGDGLGLWIVDHIVHAHKGTVCLTCNRDPTTFELRLPTMLQHRWSPYQIGAQ